MPDPDRTNPPPSQQKPIPRLVHNSNRALEAQRKGKSRMKPVGSVQIPQEAFMAVLDTGE